MVEGRASARLLLGDRIGEGTMARCQQRTTDVAAPQSSPGQVMYGCSKNAPDPTLLSQHHQGWCSR